MTFDGRRDPRGRMQVWFQTSSIPSSSGETFFHDGGWSDITGNSSNANDGATGIIYSGLGVWTVQQSGTYAIEFAKNWDANTTGRRILFMWIDQATPGSLNAYRRDTRSAAPMTFATLHTLTCRAILAAGQTVKFGQFQDSGGSLGASTNAGPLISGANRSHYAEFRRIS